MIVVCVVHRAYGDYWFIFWNINNNYIFTLFLIPFAFTVKNTVSDGTGTAS